MHRLTCALLVSCLASTAAVGQETAKPNDPFAPLRILEGTWKGQSEGFGQVADVNHRWEPVLGGKFLRLTTRSAIVDDEGKETVREDVGYASWSAAEEVLRFRHFLSEGFINTFTIDPIEGPERGLNFEPESTEGFPDMAARLVLRFDGSEGYEMVLELGSKGALEACQWVTMKRAR